jgi:hypothetical protein
LEPVEKAPLVKELYDYSNPEQRAVFQKFGSYYQFFGDMFDTLRSYSGSEAEAWAKANKPELDFIIGELRVSLGDSIDLFRLALNSQTSTGFYDSQQRLAQLEGERTQFLSLFENFVTQAVSWSPAVAIALGAEVNKLKEDSRDLYSIVLKKDFLLRMSLIFF